MYYEKLSELYQSINIYLLQEANADDADVFKLTIRIAFIKSLQLNQQLHSKIEDEYSFLFLSTLRGVCEEIIVLKYINDFIKNHDKSLLISALLKNSIRKDLEQQTAFINKYRPAQPVLNESLAESFPGENISEILSRNNIISNKGEIRKDLPPIEQMASKVGLSELYNYIYRASCNFVHFNPRIMLRTVWYENNQPENSKISITNFNKYYYSFSSFYGSYLFGLLFQEFKDFLQVDAENKIKIVEIMEHIRKTTHYPELVT